MKAMKATSTLLIFFVLLSLKAFAGDTQFINDSSQFPFQNYRGLAFVYGGDIRCVAYHPKGKVLASSGIDNLIQLWDVENGKFLDPLRGHEGDVNSIAFSSDGTWIASGSDDGTLRLWKQEDKNTLKWEERQIFSFDVTVLWIVLNPFTNDVTSVAFGGDNMLACGTKGDKVFVWRYDPDTEAWVKRIKLEPGHGEDVKSVAFSPIDDGTKDLMILASASNDRTVKLWNIKELEDLWNAVENPKDWGKKGKDLNTEKSSTFRHSAPLTSVAFNNKGDFTEENTSGYDFATGSEDHTVILWDIYRQDSGEISAIKKEELEGHTGAVRSVAFSPDGEVLITGGDDQTISIWDGATGDLHDWRRMHEHGITSVAVTRADWHKHKPMLMATGSIDDRVLHLQHERLIDVADKASLILDQELFTAVAYGTEAYRTDPTIENGGSKGDTGNDGDDGDRTDPTIGYRPTTYFIFKSKFPNLDVAGTDKDNILWDSCKITLDIPSERVPAQPVDDANSEDERLEDPGYFMYPMKTPADRLADVDKEYGFLKLGWRSVGERGGAALTGLLTGAVVGSKVGATVGATVGTAVAPIVGTTTGAFLGGVIGAVPGAATGFVVGLLWEGLVKNRGRYDGKVAEILKATADPSFVLTPDGIEHPTGEFDTLFLVRDKITYVNLKVALKYRLKGGDQDEIYLVKYEERKDLESIIPAAPGTGPIALSDYPPFQQLPPEVQEYLLRYFGEFETQREATDWQIPEVTSLLPNYPNPFNPETWIPYQLANPADVTLTIYDIHGRVVRALDLGHQRAGMYHSRSRAAHWDGRNAVGEPVASGVYFYTLTAGEFTATRKMLIRK